MANRGLKSYTKQIKYNIGGIEASVNPYINDANLIYTLPIFETTGYDPISVSLIYNHNKVGTTSEFGKGIRMNHYFKVRENGGVGYISNPDGTEDTYGPSDSEYVNKETGLTMKKTNIFDSSTGNLKYSYFTVNDLVGNTIRSAGESSDYPEYISKKDGGKITYSTSSNTITITNKNDDTVTFTKTGTLVTSIVWKRDSAIILTATLSYDSNSYLTGVVVKNGDSVLSQYEISYSSGIVITDKKNGDKATFSFSANRVETVKWNNENAASNLALTNTYTYSAYRTTITNEHGIKTVMVFDWYGFLRFVKDDKNNVVSYRYDRITKKMLAECPIPKMDTSKNMYGNNNYTNYQTVSGITITSVTESDSLYTSIFGTSVEKYSAGGYVKYTLSDNLLATDVLTLVVWVKQFAANSGYIQLDVENNDSETVELDKIQADGEYYPVVVGKAIVKSGSSISITIQANTSIQVAGIQLVKRGFGSFYQYNEDNTIRNINSSGNETDYLYEDGLVSQSTSSTSKTTKYTRNSKGKVTRSLGAYQVTNHSEYDSKNRLTSKMLKNFSESSIYQTKASYSSDDLTTTTTDELGNKSIIVKDNFDNVVRATNALNEITNNTLNEALELKELYLNTTSSTTKLLDASYEYDSLHHNAIKKITLKNGMTYEFTYDTKDRVETISLGGSLYVSYTYDKYNNILTMMYGNNGDVVTFTYDNYNNVATLNFNGVTYTYNYNELRQLKTITNGSSTIKEYEYDLDGNVIKIVEGINEISYKHDNLGNINRKVINVEGKSYNASFDRLYRSNGCNPEALADEYKASEHHLTAFFIDNDISLSGYNKTISGRINGTTKSTYSTSRTGVIPYLLVNSSTVLTYVIEKETSLYGNYGLWIKPNYLTSGESLLRITNSNHTTFLELNVDSSHNLCLSERINGSTTTLLETEYQVEVGKWTFIALNYTVIGGVTYYAAMANDKVFEGNTLNEINISNPVFYVGTNSAANVTGVIVNYSDLLSINYMLSYYRSVKDYVINKEIISSTVDFTSTSYYKKPDGVALFPLNQDFKEADGILTFGPKEFDIRQVVATDRDRSFNFNAASGRYAYIADGSKLNFRILDVSEFTVCMRAYIESNTKEDKYFFDVYDDYGNRISLYADSTNLIHLYFQGSSYSTGIYIAKEEWKFVGLSSTQAISSGSLATYDFRIKVVIGDETYEKTISSDVGMSGGYVSVGRKYSEFTVESLFGNYTTVYPLNGQIEMLCLANEYNTTSSLQNIKECLEPTVKTTGFNEFGILNYVDVREGGTRIHRKKLEFKTGTTVKHKSQIVSKEEIKTSDSIHDRCYTTDNLGRVTAITDSVFGNKTYTYDERGYLTSADGKSMEYDDNGNIISCGSVVFEYDTTIKDKLVKANGQTVEYNDSNPFNPTNGNNKSYTWVGRRLTKVESSKAIVSYEYNEQGLRSKKTVNGVATKFYYDGDLLITQIKGTERLDFLYDENNMLYGFLYNNVKYFYVRDVLQNILGIIDETGTLVVKYDCDAWGNNQTITGTLATTVGEANPFRYKGYYYDSETNMYYCKSRYYVPEWCRWLNTDSIDYLEPASLSGMNLFAYCNNDPINYSDGSGHMPKWLKNVIDIGLYVVSAVVSAVVGVAVSKVASPKTAIASGVATFGALNNLTNAIYYNYISDGESTLTPSSYREGYINRWDRLDYTKFNTKDEKYNINSWRYFSEYNFHMYAWYLTGWAYKKEIPIISGIANSAYEAAVDPHNFETGKNWWRNIFYIGLGLLGI